MKRTTIAIPIYRFPAAAEFIGETIKNNPDCEYLIVDNGAPGNISNECLKLANRYIRWNENKYVTPAWNEAVNECETEYVVLLNDDAIVGPKVVRYFEEFFDLEGKEDYVLGFPKIVLNKEELSGWADGAFYNTVSPQENITNIGAYGTFIFMRTTWAKKTFPIPEKFAIWFGDNWIRDQAAKQEKKAIRIMVPVFHLVSQSIMIPHDDIVNVHRRIKMDGDEWSRQNEARR